MTSSDKPSQASQLVALAKGTYDLVMSHDGRPYGITRRGPNIARPFKGRGGLRQALARQFAEDSGGQAPSASSLADAMTVLEGVADATDPAPVHLRVAQEGQRIVLDLGTSDGAAVIVSPDGWELVDRSPVLFRRSGAMAPMPPPERGRDGIALLRDLVNMDEGSFHRLVAWLVAAWIPQIPHPVITFKGEQGTGKSYTAQALVNLIDPSPAAKRSQPRDIKAWSVQAFNSWALCLDNVSAIPPWLSDTLCRAVTGDGIVDRALYSDDDVVVLAFRRVLAMTTIDAGALAGDLAERTMILDLQPIPDNRRRGEEELDAAYAQSRPAMLGSLLDLLAAVLRELPHVELADKPRLADFARVLAAVDRIRGWSTLREYTAAARSISSDALEGDPFGSAVAAFIEQHGPFTGTAGQLLELIPPPDGFHPKWPKDAPRAGGQLKRVAPLLRSVGIHYDDTQRTHDGRRQRLITLTPVESSCKTLSALAPLSGTGPEQAERADSRADSTAHLLSGHCPQPGSLDSADSGPDSKRPLLSGDTPPSDLHGYPSADSRASADSNSPQLSIEALRCPSCRQPMNPDLTAAGYLTHPTCPPPAAGGDEA